VYDISRTPILNLTIPSVKRSLPKYDRSLLISSKVLAQRSALPAVFSKAPIQHRSSITHEEKDRLLRIGRRNVKGPFNALIDIDPTEFGAGSAILEPTEAVKKSGTYDVWTETADGEPKPLKEKVKFKDPNDFLLPLVVRPRVKVRLCIGPACAIHKSS